MIQAVVIDSREPDWIKKLKFGGAPVATMQLDSGDVQVVCDDGEMIIVERKTPDDFLGSLEDNRLFVQISKLRQVSRWAYVMVTGEFQRGANGNVVLESRATKWNWNAVQGALLSIQESGVYVQHCAGDNDFENAVMRLANRARDQVSWIPPARNVKVISGDIALLSALPNVGIETAQKWLEYCGTPAWVLHSLTTDDDSMPRAGKVTKDFARRILFGTRNKDMVLVPMTREAYEELKRGNQQNEQSDQWHSASSWGTGHRQEHLRINERVLAK